MDEQNPPPEPAKPRPVPILVQRTRDEFLRLITTDKRYKEFENTKLEAIFEANRARLNVIRRRIFLWEMAEINVLDAAGFQRPKMTKPPRPEQLDMLIRGLYGDKDLRTEVWPASHEEFMDREEGDPLEQARKRYQRRLRYEEQLKVAERAQSKSAPQASQNPPASPQ